MQAHYMLGNGFQEVIYQRALFIDRVCQNCILCEFEMPNLLLRITNRAYRVAFLINEIISLEIKAITQLEPVYFAQAINYIEA